MSIDPTDIHDIPFSDVVFHTSTGSVAVVPRPQPLIERAPVRIEAISAKRSHAALVRTDVRRTESEYWAWDEAGYQVEHAHSFIDNEGESLSPIYDEVKRDTEARTQLDEAAVRWTISSLRRMHVVDLRAWVANNLDADDVFWDRLSTGDRIRKIDLIDVARDILKGNR